MNNLTDFLELFDIKYYKNVDLATFCTIHVSSFAKIFILPDKQYKLIELLDFLLENKIDFRLVGKMSNLLPVKENYDVIVCTRGLGDIRYSEGVLSVDCGASMQALISFALKNSLSGFEELSGIPGSIGGMLRMNAGAYGKVISDNLISCEIYDIATKQFSSLSKDQLQFSYRDSILRRKKEWVVLCANFLPIISEKETIKEKINYYRQNRNRAQPSGAFSLGSVFLRTDGTPAPGYLIDKAGLKGLSVGGMRVSDVHAGFFVNTGNGTAKDFLELKRIVKERIYSLYKVDLKEEFEEL